MTIGLKPCPRCGSDCVDFDSLCGDVFFKCECGVSFYFAGSREDAFAAWNRRVYPSEVIELILAAKKIELGSTPDHQGWPVPVVRGLEGLKRTLEAFKDLE